MLCIEENLMQPELLDIVEVLIDLPAYALQAGTRGTVVHHYPDNAFEVEFMNEDGETTALCPILATQCIVVWKASTKKWLPAEEQAADLVSHLPEDAKQEVLDFARFLYSRKRQKCESSGGKQSTDSGETRM
jgi:Domain of unknown function (DUF4926)/Protein of unknown function (DUF2281)